MKEVLLIYPGSNLRKHGSAEPLPILGLAGVLEQQGFQVGVLDGAISEITPDKLIGYKTIGVTSTTPQYPKALSILKMIQNLQKETGELVKTLLGGPHATVFKDRVLEDGWTSACIGEGDLVIGDMVTGKLQGIVQGILAKNLDDLPYPARHLIEQRYTREGDSKPSMSVMGMRGCPYSCIYCTKEITGTNVRYRSVDNIAKEIKQARDNSGIEKVVFYDDTFTLNKPRTLQLCGELEKLGVSWICNTRVDRVDEEVLTVMKRGGCTEVSFGLESANQDVLDFIKKGTKPGQGIKAIQIAREVGLNSRIFLMFGFPVDSWRSVEDNLNFLQEANPDAVRLSLVVPMHGSELYNRATEFTIKLPINLNDYYYLGPNGPRTFITRTRYLNETEFPAALEKLQKGIAKWASTESAHVTNIRF